MAFVALAALACARSSFSLARAALPSARKAAISSSIAIGRRPLNVGSSAA
eukprot:CAMPEP_0119367758 /NCGR_PEP_ID=MMETSP1334-20130426/14501_1 /TAXON_ID=127549 /ORGANISM="Calcidiscus leptoporus, Strain RCC1130" /LENGTH=49 /DNA_ID= /DNA_START= /DNA_END= /DNA_ORIENTATION=